MFPAETYIHRREALTTHLAKGIVLLLGHDNAPVNFQDNTYPFRQDSTFLYYTGLDHPGLAAVIDLDDGTECVFGEDVTVEPGIYFIPELIDRWKAEERLPQFIDYQALEPYRGFGGIRIEDDVLVTEQGHRILGRPIPKAIPDVERACLEHASS